MLQQKTEACSAFLRAVWARVRAPTWLPGAPPLRAGWEVRSLLLSQMAGCRRWRHKKCSHTSFMLLRHTQMAIPLKKPGSLRPDFYSCSFIYFFEMQTKKNACCQQDQTDIPRRTSSLFKVSGLLLTWIPSAQASTLPGSTLEKPVPWKHTLGGSLTPFSSTPLNAQMYFSHAYA